PIRAAEAGRLAGDGALELDHVIDGNTFGDADGELEARIYAFENGICCGGGRNEDGGGGGAGLLHRFGDGVENGDLVFKKLAAFAGRDACDHLRTVGEAELRVPGAKSAGYALDEDAGVGINEDGHFGFG